MALFDRFKAKKKDEEQELTPGQQDREGSQGETRKADPVLAEDLTRQPAAENETGKGNLLARFKQGLSKTRKNVGVRISNLVKSSKELNEDFWEQLEEILIEADVGVGTSLELVGRVRSAARKQKMTETVRVQEVIRAEILQMLTSSVRELNIVTEGPTVILVVGVNGAGKTTSIAKLAYHFKNDGRKVILAAADTFRAAAIDQLQIWADRVGVELIRHQEGADPGAVVFDALHAARARNADVLIIDTAGRLQNKTNLMKEISKIRKVIEREIAGAPHEVLLVVDATTGQNAVSQAKIFQEATGVSGIILTKLDGTAKGGVVLAVARELDIPVKLVGIGESLEDLREFDAGSFTAALFDD